MLKLETKADLDRLISEGIAESLALDYKGSPALAKDNKSRDNRPFKFDGGRKLVQFLTDDIIGEAALKPVDPPLA